MARGIIVERLIRKTHSNARDYRSGPWSTQCAVTSQDTLLCSLHHYGTRMLEWHYHPNQHPPVTITGWWVGHGSVSDQQGVNAALKALGSEKRYYRDERGGGPRVNPYRVAASVSRGITAITPPVY